MAGYRDEHEAAIERVEELEQQLEELRAGGPEKSKAPSRKPYMVLCFVACGALIAFGLYLSSPFASAVGATLGVAALVLMRQP